MNILSHDPIAMKLSSGKKQMKEKNIIPDSSLQLYL